MGTETKIGIVTGLVIVVVASIYFFYGKESPRDDFMLVADSKATSPPKIPPTTDQKTQMTQSHGRHPADRSPPRQPIVRRTPPRQQDHRPGLPRTATDQERLARQRVPSAQPAFVQPAASPSSPAAQPQRLGANELVNAAEEMGPPAPAPVNLRTAPSQNLIDATRQNTETGPISPDRDLALLTDRRDRGTEPPSSQMPTRIGEARQNPPPMTPPAKPAERPTERSPVASTPPAGTTALPDWPKKHRIAEGDTFVGLAERYYKNAVRADAIVKANPQIRDPRRLRIGEEVTIPPPVWEQDVRPQAAVQKPGSADGTARPAERVAEASAQKQAPPRTYRVREGDTFYSIAQSLYRNGSRWEEILKLNRPLVRGDPKKLRPGMVINLPE